MKTLLFFISIVLSLNIYAQISLKSSNVILKCNLKENSNPSSMTISSIKKGEIVNIIDYENGFFKVNYKGIVGFINDIYINEPQLIDQIKQEKENKKAAKIEEERILANKRFKTIDAESRAADKKLMEEAQARAERREAEHVAKIKQFKDDSIKIENEHKRFVAQAKLNEENRKKQLIEKYGTEKAKLIIARKVYIGMTASEAKDSWGNPYDINRTITINKTREQWVYGNRKYLYFENGVLTTIQE